MFNSSTKSRSVHEDPWEETSTCVLGYVKELGIADVC
jgi:hypothetical protein